MKAEPTRRAVLQAGLAGSLAGSLGAALSGCGGAGQSWPGVLDGPDWHRGHALRDGDFPEPEGPVEDVGVLIGGGGVAGLAAAWRLAEAGFADFALVELEDHVGGNARAGRNAVSAYPLGAHYLPVPNREARGLRTMLRGFGLITGEDAQGAPVYDPYALCADLDERLLWRGAWQEGLFPASGLDAATRAQHTRFTAQMATLRAATGADGRPAFAIPRALSSDDPRFTALDATSFAAWLDAQGYTAPALRAWLRYGCRDDYGTEPEQVSAWAGIHYFAGRRGWAAGDAGDRELTWPEGNGRLVALMAGRVQNHLRPGRSVVRVSRAGDHALVDVLDHARGKVRRWRTACAILAMPHFVAARIAPQEAQAGTLRYAPWVVANVTVTRHPGGRGAGVAWDNVSSASDSLGYVVATHQSEAAPDGPTVLTWYMPLSQMTPKAARKLMMTRSLGSWQRIVADDLLAMNPDLAGAITRIDVWRWGHAMISPTPGFLTDPARHAAIAARPPVVFAHSDLSGLSLFEEAHYRGLIAAEAALAHCGHPFESLA